MAIQAALFDFDGTISTLRHGWEAVMEPMMLEMIAGDAPVTDALRAEVHRYIDESTGIQTIGQMKWLTEAIARYGLNPSAPTDPWACKAEYNRRLMERVQKRRAAIESGAQPADDFLIGGSVAFLQLLRAHGVKLYVASGTDQADVEAEARILGVADYFEAIRGAQPHAETCAKEEALRGLIELGGLRGDHVAVIGDGKVEIRLGREIGAHTLGLATDEARRTGVDPVKQARLQAAGAERIAGDFLAIDELAEWLLS